jgi:homoserine O-succinyltransferase
MHMPIKIANDLPARPILESEHIFVMTETRALTQDIRPLRIGIVNLMPTKIATETQILRCLANTPLQIEIDLIHTQSYTAKNTSEEHLATFYRTFDEIKDINYDGVIITGAPVENMDFEEVEYWDELCRIMEWTKTHVHSTMHICWASQAGLYYHYGIPKRQLPYKLSGIYRHHMLNEKARLFRGFDDEYFAPHSRHTESDPQMIADTAALRILAVSPEAGIHIVSDHDNKQFFVSGHSEYDLYTLRDEYQRDVAAGLTDVKVPVNYFPNDDPTQKPVNRWRAHGQLLFTNWLNYYVYQTTPYDLKKL